MITIQQRPSCGLFKRPDASGGCRIDYEFIGMGAVLFFLVFKIMPLSRGRWK